MEKRESIAITEMRHPRTTAIDTLPTQDIVALINDEDAGGEGALADSDRSCTPAPFSWRSHLPPS